LAIEDRIRTNERGEVSMDPNAIYGRIFFFCVIGVIATWLSTGDCWPAIPIAVSLIVLRNHMRTR
jgi:hypothetical protein